jgi:hypothetical protein
MLFSVRMRVRTALLLLLTLGLTLGFGVHPCGAMEQEHPGTAGTEAQAASAMPPCHAAAPADEGGHGCCGSKKGKSSGHSDPPCPHVCHATALPAVTPPPFLAVQSVTTLVAGHVESASAAPVRSIDHVPLP